MAKDATVGFMLWDGDSVGTMLNVWRLMQKKKTSLVYVQTNQAFFADERNVRGATIPVMHPKAGARIQNGTQPLGSNVGVQRRGQPDANSSLKKIVLGTHN